MMTEEEAIEKAHEFCIGCIWEKPCHETTLYCDYFWMRVDELEEKDGVECV